MKIIYNAIICYGLFLTVSLEGQSLYSLGNLNPQLFLKIVTLQRQKYAWFRLSPCTSMQKMWLGLFGIDVDMGFYTFEGIVQYM